MILREKLPAGPGPSLPQACVFSSTPNALGTKALGVQVKMGNKSVKTLCSLPAPSLSRGELCERFAFACRELCRTVCVGLCGLAPP